ncbi:plasmid mobilization relaxosome protein MobC, partial [Rhodobacterales bacterium HKCCE4037]|nr:plasmid mobilization relaxosome protein MobC [Rhodobacterales bacterium HKCCE4037]
MTDDRRKKRGAPFSLRLSFEERAKLERQAGSLPLASYIKSVILDEEAPTYRQRRKPVEADQKLLAEVLACLGSTRLANNLNQLAKAANSGALYCDSETKSELNRACDDVRAMRLLLM